MIDNIQKTHPSRNVAPYALSAFRPRRPWLRGAARGLALGAALSACSLSVSLSVATPTALERQLLGEYEELDRELVLASSVRGSPAPGGLEDAKLKAIRARALQRFNGDDLAELEARGCIAEGAKGQVVERPCAEVDDEVVRRRRARVVAEENQARTDILSWSAFAAARSAGRAAATEQDLLELRLTYARLLRESAAPGVLFEAAPGHFEPVSR
ncbi:MAG: hypothetical protein HYV07_12850 [Deltaproteobacteria bacterium]|nr:hypothetical protein [Deltaproteobacteria bacterium]